MTTTEVAHLHSPLGHRGDMEYFERMLEEGYTKVQFGRGPFWRDDISDREASEIETDVEALWAFYKPDSRQIRTQEFLLRDAERREDDPSVGPVERTYSPDQFHEHLRENEVKLNDRKNLEELLQRVRF